MKTRFERGERFMWGDNELNKNKDCRCNEENNNKEESFEEKGPGEGVNSDQQEEAVESEEVILSLEEQRELIDEKEEYLEKLKRLQAEFENYKKRMNKEREKDKLYGAEKVMEDILPILDNFERALFNVDEEKMEDEFYTGIKMIYDQLMELLEQNGLSKIEAEGEKFDPNYHEAIMMIESEEHSKNTVVEEMQAGYILHDKLIRASRVKVAK